MTISSFSALRQRAGLSVEDLAKETGFSARTVYRWESGEMEPRAAVIRALEVLSAYPPRPANSQSAFRFIDLFAGIGGLRRGFEPLGGECVFTSEWDKFSQKTYRANFDCEHELAGDITKIGVDDIPEHDVLLAGFPCQPFSIAGVSKKNAFGQTLRFACGTQGIRQTCSATTH